MKNWKFTLGLGLITLSMITSTLAHAEGEKSGNGGVVFVCQGKLQLVDAWEAEDSNDPLNLSQRVTPQMDMETAMAAMADEYLARVDFYEPVRATEYRELWNQLMADLKELRLNPKSRETKLIRFTSGELPESLDSDEITRPRNCDKKQAITQKQPILSSDRLLTIDRQLWDLMTAETRTLILFHEINVMNSVRNGFTKTTSPARIINRFFGSPEQASTQTVCAYMNLLLQTGMTIIHLNNLYTYTFPGSVTTNLATVQTSCWKSTRRLQKVDFKYLNPKLIFTGLTNEQGSKVGTRTISLTSLNFAENANEITAGTFVDPNYYSDKDLNLNCKNCFVKPEKSFERSENGSYRLNARRWKSRSMFISTFDPTDIDLGPEVIEISSQKDGVVQLLKNSK